MLATSGPHNKCVLVYLIRTAFKLQRRRLTSLLAGLLSLLKPFDILLQHLLTPQTYTLLPTCPSQAILAYHARLIYAIVHGPT